MIVYLVVRVPCGCKDGLMQPIGVALTVDEAIAMCSSPMDVVTELETGKVYPPGEECPVRQLLPLCPGHRGRDEWVTARGLALAETP